VVTVTGGSNKRVSLAALIAVKPGQRPRLIYRVHHGAARAVTSARASPRPSTPGCSTPRTSSSAARSSWSGNMFRGTYSGFCARPRYVAVGVVVVVGGLIVAIPAT